MATIPIFSPNVPFLGLIPGGLSPGRMVRIKGVINKYGERCQIHFQSGAAVSPRDDVMLHISIRPNEQAIVRNTLQNQVVGPEERYGGCPIRYGEPFDMLVLAESVQYKIAINGVHFCTFNHRLPLYNARYISVSGVCVIHSIISEADVPGAAPYHPPPVQYPPPYAPPIGFVPNNPPSSLPPPPPYTPLPAHPIGGGSGHYPGAGSFPPPPPPPPTTGYPHHATSPRPGYPHHQPAVPFSESPGGNSNLTDTLKQSVAGGIKKTRDFLRNATGDKSYPAQSRTPVSSNSHHDQARGQFGFVTTPSAPAFGGGYNVPAHPTASQFDPRMVPEPYGGQQHRQHGGFSTPTGLASTALAAGTSAAVASHFLPKRKTKKVLKYGAAAGAAGLGGYALSKAFRRKSSSSSSSSSSSDSD